MSQLSTKWLPKKPGSPDSLELVFSLPYGKCKEVPILFIHGAFCSAHDFQFFLPYFASRGYPAYALSLRGHGKSWATSRIQKHIFTSIDHYASDIALAVDYLNQQHDCGAKGPIVAGHSLGGGYLQYFLARDAKAHDRNIVAFPSKVAGLVLLGSAPLTGGGKQIMANWEMVETQGDGYKYPWSPRSQLETAQQVRAAFFHPETKEEVISEWMNSCQTKIEGIRAGLSVLSSFAKAPDVLRAINGFGNGATKRKVLCIAAEADRLVPPAMVADNANLYSTASLFENSDKSVIVTQVEIAESGHHLMMDRSWESCAKAIFEWLEGS